MMMTTRGSSFIILPPFYILFANFEERISEIGCNLDIFSPFQAVYYSKLLDFFIYAYQNEILEDRVR